MSMMRRTAPPSPRLQPTALGGIVKRGGRSAWRCAEELSATGMERMKAMANQKMHAELRERLRIADLLQPAMSNRVR